MIPLVKLSVGSSNVKRRGCGPGWGAKKSSCCSFVLAVFKSPKIFAWSAVEMIATSGFSCQMLFCFLKVLFKLVAYAQCRSDHLKMRESLVQRCFSSPD